MVRVNKISENGSSFRAERMNAGSNKVFKTGISYEAFRTVSKIQGRFALLDRTMVQAFQTIPIEHRQAVPIPV